MSLAQGLSSCITVAFYCQRIGRYFSVPLNVSIEVCLEFQSSYSLCPGASESCLPCPSLSHLCWQLDLGREDCSGSSILQRPQEEIGSWRSVNAPLSGTERCICWGQRVAFTGDSSPGQWRPQHGKIGVELKFTFAKSVLRSLHGGSWGGRGGLISPRTEDSVQLAVGHVEQLKGCEKIKGTGLAFLVWKMLLSALNWSVEL